MLCKRHRRDQQNAVQRNKNEIVTRNGIKYNNPERKGGSIPNERNKTGQCLSRGLNWGNKGFFASERWDRRARETK